LSQPLFITNVVRLFAKFQIISLFFPGVSRGFFKPPGVRHGFLGKTMSNAKTANAKKIAANHDELDSKWHCPINQTDADLPYSNHMALLAYCYNGCKDVAKYDCGKPQKLPKSPKILKIPGVQILCTLPVGLESGRLAEIFVIFAYTGYKEKS
jgi:hypothetical protein